MQSHANDYWEHKSTADFLSFGNDQRPSPAKSGSDIFGKHFQEQMLPEKREQARSGGGRLLYFRWKSFCLHFNHACAFLSKRWADTGALHHGGTGHVAGRVEECLLSTFFSRVYSSESCHRNIARCAQTEFQPQAVHFPSYSPGKAS